MGDSSCNVECAKNAPKTYEFVGPVKIVLVDQPKNVYKWKIWSAAFIRMAYLLMGFTILTILFYTLTFKSDFFINLHILLCTSGFQLCVPSGIASLNEVASPLKKPDRKFEHLFLQVIGLGCGLAGSAIIIMKHFKFTIHSCSGLAAGGLCCLAAFCGFCIYFTKMDSRFPKLLRCFHATFGILAFLCSSFCFLNGLLNGFIKAWLPIEHIDYFLIGFCVFYSLAIVAAPLKKMFT